MEEPARIHPEGEVQQILDLLDDWMTPSDVEEHRQQLEKLAKTPVYRLKAADDEGNETDWLSVSPATFERVRRELEKLA